MLAALLSSPAAASAQDAIQWRVEDGGNGHWYWVNPSTSNWTNSQGYASAHGGHLATPGSESENEYISELVQSSLPTPIAWLGGYQDLSAPDYSEPAGGWRWVTDEPWVYSTWESGMPANNSQARVLLLLGNRWYDFVDTQQAPSCIEWSADCNGDGIVDYGQILDGSLPDANGDGTPDCCETGGPCPPPVQWRVEDGGNGHWYWANLRVKSWTVSQAFAAAHGGNLATPTSASEDSFLSEFLAATSVGTVWIGAYQDLSASDYSEPAGGWRWVTGESWVYSQWSPNQPDNNGAEHVAFMRSGSWLDGIDAPVIASLIEWSADCNGDGIVDYGQILNGSLADANGNGVPDCCDAGTQCTPSAGDAIQWRVEDGGNGHWYELVVRDPVPGGVHFADLDAEAAAVGGHSATVTSAAEWNFLLSSVEAAEPTTDDLWIGFTQSSCTGWQWTNGEAVTFTAWGGSNCGAGPYPNDGCAGIVTRALVTNRVWDCGWVWDDFWQGQVPPASHIIEWSADCNGDGIVDYGQILDGSLADANGNGVPDCCEAGESCDPPTSDAVQWRTEVGGNGHWYSVETSLLGWDGANTLATALGGYVATTPSASENVFVHALCAARGVVQARLGGFQDLTASDYSEPSGGWRWVTGEPWSYVNWGVPEPTNGLGVEHSLHFQGSAATWNDVDQPTGYATVIEWSADCNVDGIVDYGQILDGSLADANGNGIPDACEAPPCLGDITNDGHVDGVDLATILTGWGSSGQGAFDTDIDNNGIVDGGDLGFVLANWGACP